MGLPNIAEMVWGCGMDQGVNPHFAQITLVPLQDARPQASRQPAGEPLIGYLTIVLRVAAPRLSSCDSRECGAPFLEYYRTNVLLAYRRCGRLKRMNRSNLQWKVTCFDLNKEAHPAHR